ncbi:MAG: hypothetical protein GY845_17865 [Planctomycetes bacterium]|nr:hypothetical protein [Planctomycetota bacterium]
MKDLRLLVLIYSFFFLGEIPLYSAVTSSDKILEKEMNQRLEYIEKEIETYRNEIQDYSTRREAIQNSISEGTKKSIENLKEEIERYKDEIRSYKERQQALQEAISESTKKSKETMEILDKFSAKSINVASYTLTAIVFVFTAINIFFVYQIGSTNKETRKIIREARDKAETEFQRQLGIFDETRVKTEQKFQRQLEIFNETRVSTEEKFNKGLENFDRRIEKIRLNLDNISEQFIDAMDNKRKLMDALTRVLSEKIRQEIPSEEVHNILDTLFQEELDKYELESYIADLQSPDPDVKERAIWGIEAIGPEKFGKDRTSEILQKVVDDPSEGPEIRLQAQRSIENIKRGYI